MSVQMFQYDKKKKKSNLEKSNKEPCVGCEIFSKCNLIYFLFEGLQIRYSVCTLCRKIFFLNLKHYMTPEALFYFSLSWKLSECYFSIICLKVTQTYDDRDCDTDVRRDLGVRISARKRYTEIEQPVRNTWRRRRRHKARVRAAPPVARNFPYNWETQCSCTEPERLKCKCALILEITHRDYVG